MTTLPRRLAALATVLLALTMVAVLALSAAGAPIATVRSSAPSPSASATASGKRPTPSVSEDALAVFAKIERQVAAMRQLEPADIGPPEVISRTQLAKELHKILDETWTPRQLAADNLTLQAMGLLSRPQDIRELTESLYGDQVLGFYDFDTKRMVVVTDEGLTAEAKITYAHEFTHAMQDAAFDTGAAHDADAQEDDAALARLALEEGDASVVMLRWAFDGNLSSDELSEIGETPVPDMSGIPEWMVRQLTFPYERGAGFVSQLFARGGWELVDAAYRHPPASTEQVLHIDKYLGDEVPVSVKADALAGRLGSGWQDVESTTMGEAMVGIWLQQLGVGQSEASTAAAGWGGDRLSVARGPRGTWAMAWQLTWDSPRDAEQFVAAHDDLTADLPFSTGIRRVNERTTLVVHASSPALLGRLGGG
jgi:hypothetical protein